MSRRDRQRRRRRNRGSALKRAFALGGVLVVSVIVVGVLAVTGWVVNVAQSAPDLSALKPQVPGSPSQVFASDGESLGYIWSPSVHDPVSGSIIPQRLKEATIAIEDRRFYQHGALDYQGIVRAAIRDAFSGGTSLQGASTLTMQLVDNQYLPTRYKSSHNLKYKIIQAKLAEELEGRHDKNWILNTYLNVVPYGTVGGQTAYGVGAASRMFFDKPVSKLDLAQDALLAGLPQAPSEYNPFIDLGAARHRRMEVLQSMVQAHYIDEAQAMRANREPLEVKNDPTLHKRSQPYVFDYIQHAVAADLCPKTPNHCKVLTKGGLKIYTTIDLHKQELAREAILSHEGGPGQPGAGLATVDPANGHILAIASSGNYDTTKFDYATQAFRQPGSAFKVFALMTLIHDYHGDPNATFYNSHFLATGWLPSDPTWSVHTAEESYQGDINITRATITSDNTVFAQLAVDEGIGKMDAMAHAMGITSPLDGNPAEVIGGLRYGVTPLQMADAYATIANGGDHVHATIINRVVFPDGSVRNFGDEKPKRVFSDGEAYAATQVLKQVITNPGGTGTSANYGCPAAGKTGTANNLDNAWFVGYTPRMSTAVWVGYPQGNLPMVDGFGGALAAPIWHDYMSEASGGYCGEFPQPATPFHGTAFFGPHSATGGSGTTLGGSGSSSSGGGAVTGQPPSPYNNRTLYAHPPQGAPPSGGGTTGAGTHGGGGKTGGTVGLGGGSGGGGGGGGKSH
jgi:penicillin-binding protein 1A